MATWPLMAKWGAKQCPCVNKTSEWKVERADGGAGQSSCGHGDDFPNGQRRTRARRRLHHPLHGDRNSNFGS